MVYFFIRFIFSEIKMNKFSRKSGFSQILLLIIISFAAIALPIVTRLVQQNQENRSSAATDSTYGCTSTGGCASCGTASACSAAGCSWSYTTGCTSKSGTKYARGGCNTSTGLYSCTTSSTGTYTSSLECTGTSTDSSCIKIGKANGSSCTTASECASKVCYSGICTAGRQYWFYNGSKCTQTGDSYKDISVCTGNVRSTCYSTEADCNSAHGVVSQTYWFYNGSKCTQTGDSYASVTLCTNNVRSACYGSIDECNNNIPCTSGLTRCSSAVNGYETCTSGKWGGLKACTSSQNCAVKDGVAYCKDDGGSSGPPDPPNPPTVLCTANTVSTTECYDTTHLKKCDSVGTAWIQGDPCATGQVCKNGVCGVFGDSKLSFKIAFLEVKTNVSCLDNFRNVALTMGKAGTDFKKDLTVDILGTGETNSNGFAIFKAENIAMDIGFSGATNVYVKIKGQVHSKMYYCTKDQSAKTTSQSCNLAIDGTVNNLYNYPILAGDVDQNGIVNSLDFGEIRTNLFKTGCGLKSDLTGDGIVNNLDVRLFKIALEAKYDE